MWSTIIDYDLDNRLTLSVAPLPLVKRWVQWQAIRGSWRNEMARKTAGKTLVDVVQQNVRDAILGGLHPAGQKVSITAIAEEQGVSLSVAREALTRLVAEGLLTLESMQGFRVMAPTAADLDDLCELLEIAMGAAIRDGVGRGDRQWEANLVAALHLLQRAYEMDEANPSRVEELERAHAHFMQTLTSASANVRLQALLASLYRAQLFYHRMTVQLFEHEGAQFVRQCAAILDAVLKRDAELTASLMIAQIAQAQRVCHTHLEQLKEPC